MEPELHSLTHCARNRRLLGVAVVIGAIAAISTCIWWYQTKNGSLHFLNNEAQKSIVISAGINRASPIYTITEGSSAPIIVTIGDIKRSALDMVELPDGSKIYSLIESATTQASNLYKIDKLGKATQLTKTESVKYSFSLNASKNHLVYEDSKSIDSKLPVAVGTIMQLDLISGNVVSISSGVRPHYLSSGSILIEQADGAAVYPPQANGKGVIVLTPTLYSQVAVSPKGEHIAAYNRITRSVDVFDVTSSGSLSYKSTIHAAEAPEILSFGEKDPISLESIDSSKGIIYKITTYSNPVSSRNIVNTNGFRAQRLIYESY